MPPSDHQARRRWAVMQLVRMVAVAAALFGVYALAERGLARPDLGAPLLLLGAAGFFAGPALLAKRWRSR
ncbi:hypothetical protein EYB45_00400 [Erythrobacteraceae bacterium CFH 75059]|uniref:hypothetical protein n=1 Tax=Qipengyuania thermophila TaxID=2509361 RepID=UPI0010217461|nr:hypothetical protein [Qipengyuania thermophila]TCD06242.1 hypothetical protein EYB45_00400 [Erythrobacteraceae bacterium CFH 75059]